MADGTHIEWTDATWPIVQGCDYESPGCTHCYVPRTLWRLMHNPNPIISAPLVGLVRKHDNGMPVFTGQLALREDRLNWPLKWKKPRRIFVPSHGDLFHESVPDVFIDRVFAIMALCPQHTFQVLTKRAKRMREYIIDLSLNAGRDQKNNLPSNRQVRLSDANTAGSLSITKNDIERHLGRIVKFDYDPPMPSWPLTNVWLGVSVEDQQRADERIPDLLDTPATVRFLSCEPLLGPIDLDTLWLRASPSAAFLEGKLMPEMPAWTRLGAYAIDWVIAGNESGPRRRPGDLAWMRSLRDQCAAAGVAFFGKQDDKVKPLPADLMIRQFPNVEHNATPPNRSAT